MPDPSNLFTHCYYGPPKLNTQHMEDNSLPTRAAQERLVDEELLVVREAVALLGKSQDEGFVVREILHLLSEFLGLNRGRVVLPDPETGELRIVHAYGLTQEEIARGKYLPGEGITGRVMTGGQTAIVQDVDAEPLFLFRAVAREHLPHETVSFIALPLEQGGRQVGVLAVHRLRERPRSLARDQQVLKIAATLITHVILLNEFIRERTSRLESENRELKWALTKDLSTYGSFGIVGESLQLGRSVFGEYLRNFHSRPRRMALSSRHPALPGQDRAP